MSIQLQHFDHDKSQYERPSQKWVCGWTSDGEACHRGPDNRGRCHITAECAPQRRGDRWHCTRAASFGGLCEQGPMPKGNCSRPIPCCQPVRSLRAKRTLIVWSVSAATLGALLVLGLGPWNRAFLSPGQLSTAHGINDQQCAACHNVAQSNEMIIGLPEGDATMLQSDSERCLNCHSILQFPDLAHNLPLESLRQISIVASENQSYNNHAPVRIWAAQLLPGSQQFSTQSIVCATCHNEHRGRTADIKFMSNTRCQSCHQQQFASFAKGHPEFTTYFPFINRSAIAFNHVTHLRQYFAEDKYADNSPTDCMVCHKSGGDGRRMLTLPFDTSCASCHHHADEIHGTGISEPSIAFFRLPSVAISTLEQNLTWLGEDPWPADAFDDDLKMTPFMILLLEVDEDVAADLKTLSNSGSSLADLSSVDEQTLEAAGRLVWAVKRLLNELIQGGQPVLESRLIRALGDKVAVRQLAALSGLTPDNTTLSVRSHETQWQVSLRAAAELWLPNLLTDVQRYEAGERSLPTTDDIIDKGNETVQLMEDTAANDNDLLDDDLLDNQEDDDLQDEQLLDDDLLEDDEILGDDLLDDDEPNEVVTVPANELINTQLSSMRSILIEYASTGRWHIDDSDYSVRYLPTGHADTFLRNWLDITANAHSTENPVAASLIFQELGRETNELKSPGRCMKCHSVDSEAGASFQRVINWTSNAALPSRLGLVRFNHSPHLNLSSLQDCSACHTLNLEADDAKQWKAMYSNTDPTKILHSFDPISKSNCAQCHLPELAGDNCLSCHNYHVGFTSPASITTMR